MYEVMLASYKDPSCATYSRMGSLWDLKVFAHACTTIFCQLSGDFNRG